MTTFDPTAPPPIKRTNHVAHGIATFLTCGLWAPVWGLRAAANKASNNVVATGELHTYLRDREASGGLAPSKWEKFWAMDPTFGPAMLSVIHSRRTRRLAAEGH